MDKKSQTFKTYNESALAMAQKYANLGPRKEDIERFFQLILNKENPAVLEIGCANGREAQEILKFTNNYLGIDISAGMIKLARERLPRARFEIADVEEYQFPANLDGIVAFASLLHSDAKQLKNVFIKAQHSLKPKGIFYISLKKGVYPNKGDTRVDQFGIRTFYYYEAEMLEKLAGSGFEKVFLDEQSLPGQDWVTIVFRKL